MAKGFFKQNQVSSKKIQKGNSKTAHCGECGLYKSCSNPKMPPTGNNKHPFLSLNYAVEEKDDYKNEQFIDDGSQFHRRKLRSLGYHIDDGIKDNAIKCNPPENKTPTMTQVRACRPKLVETINTYRPHVILAIGEIALRALISHKFNKDIGSIGKWRGMMIPDREYQAWICPIFHPNYCLSKKTSEVVEKYYEEDLKHAMNLLNVPLPYHVFEDEKSKIEILKHPNEINKYMQKLIHYDDIRLTAFDYETTGLKPYREGHKIRTCSISHGPDHAVAFPMIQSQEFQRLFARFCASTEIKKIAANAPFERDWSNVCLGMEINAIFFDTQLASHHLDNRPKITSLEFQNYVNFGIEPYDSEIKEFLKSKDVNGKEGSGNDFNTIFKADLLELLTYNGMDSLTEFRLGLVQMDRIGIDYSHLYSGVGGKILAPQYPDYKEDKRGKDNGEKSKEGKKKRKPKKKTSQKKKTKEQTHE